MTRASEVWGAARTAGGTRDDRERLSMDVAKSHRYVTLLGGAFGRKSKPDFGVEAVVVSKAMAPR